MKDVALDSSASQPHRELTRNVSADSVDRADGVTLRESHVILKSPTFHRKYKEIMRTEKGEP